ncbi:MAG: hypothetical protein EA412_03350 [Chitinophagaceae bacterium]|nr:MAG: hypothetical protein EA412_03350 [Chitinophagaceae bacterium]
MKPFYSILYVPIRPESKEKLSVGLLMRDEKQVYFHYAKHKLDVIKELLPKDAYSLLKLTLQSISRSIQEDKERVEKDKESLFPKNIIVADMVSEPAISYLSKYNKNLLSFSEPYPINVKLTKKLFNTLFQKLVDEREFISHKNLLDEDEDIILKTRELLFPKIKDRVNTDYDITPKLFKNLILPSIHIDFIGKNGMYVTGQTLNFNKREANLESDVTRQITLIDAIRRDNSNSKCFILGKEPNKKLYPKQHQLWKNVNTYKYLEFVDADEYETISEYIEKENVHPIEKS